MSPLLNALKSEWVSTVVLGVAASAVTYTAVKATAKYKGWRSTEDLKLALEETKGSGK